MRLSAKNFHSVFASLANEVDLVRPISSNPLHGVMTPETMAQLRSRNDARLKQKLKEMGNKWVLHPDNRVKRKDGKEYK